MVDMFSPQMMMIIVPVLGFALLVLVLWFGFRRMNAIQQHHLDRLRFEEQALQRREKLVLAAALAGELTENKIKCEAFITIYSELLRNLRDVDRKAMYEETGDFIHQHPPLSRNVYETHLEKLDVLGAKMAGDVASVYAAIRQDPHYFTLEANMQRAGAIRMVEMVLDDAQKTLEPIEPLVSKLNIIVRDGGKR